MAIKHIELPDIGPVTLQKRRGNSGLRISISSRGVVKVSLPPWAPYKMAIEFAKSKRDWIAKHRPTLQPLADATRVGKAHQLAFMTNLNLKLPRTQIKGNEIIISLPAGISPNHPKAQKLAEAAAVRALKTEAGQLLPRRLQELSKTHGFDYNSVAIKRLSSRWGSCDRHGNIILNCYLMQLPWQLIDYVLVHELVHTRILAHGPKFWAEMENYIPNLAQTRKEMRTHRPSLIF